MDGEGGLAGATLLIRNNNCLHESENKIIQ
jgi:hypothetical protein